MERSNSNNNNDSVVTDDVEKKLPNFDNNHNKRRQSLKKRISMPSMNQGTPSSFFTNPNKTKARPSLKKNQSTPILPTELLNSFSLSSRSQRLREQKRMPFEFKLSLFKHRINTPTPSLKEKIRQTRLFVQQQQQQQQQKQIKRGRKKLNLDRNELLDIVEEQGKEYAQFSGDKYSNETTPLQFVHHDDKKEIDEEESKDKTFEGIVNNKGTMWIGLFNICLYYVVALIGCHFFFEKELSTIDALYFASVVLTTVGYGDITPPTVEGKLFIIFMALYSVSLLGVLISTLSGHLTKYNEIAMEDAFKNSNIIWIHELNEIFDNNTKCAYESSDSDSDSEESSIDSDDIYSVRGSDDVKNLIKHTIRHHHNELKAHIKRSVWIDIMHVIVNQLPMLFFLFLIMMIVAHIEGWSIVEGIYWMVMTGTTVGFGDFNPTQTITKAICIIYLPICVIVLGESMTMVAVCYIDKKQSRYQKDFLFHRKLTQAGLSNMDLNQDGVVSNYEFLIFALKRMGKIEQDDIDQISNAFVKLDRTHSGNLSVMDIGM